MKPEKLQEGVEALKTFNVYEETRSLRNLTIETILLSRLLPSNLNIGGTEIVHGGFTQKEWESCFVSYHVVIKQGLL